MKSPDAPMPATSLGCCHNSNCTIGYKFPARGPTPPRLPRRHCKADCRGDIKGGTPHQESHREMDNHHVDWMSANARSGSDTRSFLSLRRSLRDPTCLPLH